EDGRLAALTLMLAFYAATAWQTLAQLRLGDRRLASSEPGSDSSTCAATGRTAYRPTDCLEFVLLAHRALCSEPDEPGSVTVGTCRRVYTTGGLPWWRTRRRPACLRRRRRAGLPRCWA